MAERAPWGTMLCPQCSPQAQIRQGEVLPEGWIDPFGPLICSETCRDILPSMELLPDV